MSVFIRLNQGGSVSYKDPVATVGDLPLVGNQPGDIRGVVDTNTIYMWDGASWNSTGGGGGGSPGGPDGSVQFNNSGSFDGDAELTWDTSGKILGLNGLAIHALSSTVSLVDGQASPTTAFSYNATSFNFTVIEYSLTRNTSKQVGMLFVANDGNSVTITNAFANLSDAGVDFSAAVAAGNVDIKYTTTSTGFNAFLKYSMRQWS